LAVGIFALAGIGIAMAVHDLAAVWHQSRQMDAVRIGLESRLAEARVMSLAEGSETSEPDNRGVVYEKIVTQLPLSNDEKIVLTGLYEIAVTARWKTGAGVQEEKAQIYVYQP